MQLIPLIILGLAFLVGAIALGIGHKGWSWGSVAAAWLVLLTAVGAFFLVGMLGQREREWRNVIAAYQSAIARERDALAPAGGTALRPDPALKPLGVLEDERDRWERVRDRIDTWRGRHWDDAEFTPPAEGRPGTIRLGGLENTTIHPGAELYVFDMTPIEQGGRFLGAYRVDTVDKNVFGVSHVSVPDAADVKALAQPRDGKVVVYEDLPIDRSLAFYRTPVPAQPAADGSLPADAAPPPAPGADAVPGPSKSDPEAMLRHLERKLEEVRLHDTVVGGGESPTAGAAEADQSTAGAEGVDAAAAGPDEAMPEAAPGVARTTVDPTNSETPPQGVRWARVRFTSPFDYTWPDGTVSSFAAGEALPSLPADQVAVLRERGADFTSEWSIPPGLYWANVEFLQNHSFPRKQGEAIEFEAGRTAQFDLETAKALEKDGVVAIASVIFRRPLDDGNVALRGAGAVPADPRIPSGDQLTVGVNGLVVMRRILEEDIRSIKSSREQLDRATASTREEIALRERERGELEADLEHWAIDVAAADRSAEAFATRLAAVRRDLESSESAVVSLGREFTDTIATLTRAIDEAAPAPSTPPLPADAVR